MSRRGNGEGTVYLRADGRWEGAVWVRTVSGRRRRLRVYGRTRAETHAKLVSALKRAADGVPAPDQPWKLAAYLDYWLTEAKPLLAPKTYDTYEGLVRNYLKPGLGTKSLTGLSVITAQQFFNDQLARGVSTRTVQKQRVVLSAALTQAMREELVVRNVARSVRLPSAKPKPFTPWTVEQLSQFLEVARPDPLYAAFLLVGMYGLRSGEVRGLRWSDIDWANNRILIRQQVQRYDGAMHTQDLKTKASRRDLPMLATVRQALAEHRAALDVPDDDQERLVFLTKFDNPIESGNILRSFRRVSVANGLPPIKLHHLRHTAATLLKNDGVPDRDIQLILGHESVLTTQMIYQHADISGQQRAMERAEQRLLPTAVARPGGRQSQPSVTYVSHIMAIHNIGQPALTADVEGQVFSSIERTSAVRLTEVAVLAGRRRIVSLLGGVAVIYSRQARK